MYALIAAIAKPANGNGRFKEVAIGDIPLHILFTQYARVLATLSNSFLDHPVCLDLETLRVTWSASSLTFNEFLVQNGNAALTTSNTPPVLKPVYAKYADAFHAGYKIAPIPPLASPDTDLPLSEKTALHLTRPNTDYLLFARSCLVNVNGFYHAIDADPHGVYVMEGMKSCLQSKHNQIGILSFRELGSLQCLPIQASMLYKQHPEQAYRNRVFLDLGMDLSNKTVLLVLGGYLHLLDQKTFFRVSDSQLGIDFNNLPFLERYYESRQYLDLSKLPIQRTARNDSLVGISDFFSDENIAAYLTLSQSFIVLLDRADIFIEREFVRKTKMPNMYIGYKPPLWPLVAGFGKHANYWYTYEDQQWSITCVDSARPNYLFDTVSQREWPTGSSARRPNRPMKNSSAFFLKIGADF